MYAEDSELRLNFSPMSKGQSEDCSIGMSAIRSIEGSTEVAWTMGRRARNRVCPHCTEENPPENEYNIQDRGPREDAEVVEYAKALLGGRGQTLEHDGFKFDLQIDDEVASDNTGSPQSWNQISQWIQNCQANHSRCPKQWAGGDHGTRWYPTRLLDLESLDTLRGPTRLIETTREHPQGCYMTLSHCWGTQPIIRLTSENFDAFCQRIAFEDLPKTFQDAVVITRKLGIRYLWIDSLCIIQAGPESKDDWLRESSVMDQVYRNSFLNVGATGAVDGRDGCFRDRDYMEVFRPAILKPECMTHCAEFRPKYRLVEQSFLDDWILNEPLLQRGWVYQERFLAPRMLHFGSRQMFWECRETKACESFPDYLLPPIELASVSYLTDDQPEKAVEEMMTGVMGQYRWYQIVKEYSSKVLTRPEDKLVAISGVARQYQVLKLQPDDKYWAGIWKSDLPKGLCWNVEGGAGSRPENWRAPTWAWPSVDGTINPPVKWYYEGHEKDRLLAIMGDGPEIQYVTESNPFGAMTAASWKVQTRLIPLEVVKKEDKDEWSLSYIGTKFLRSAWYPDEPTTESVVSVLCLCLASGKDGMIGLTVVRVDGMRDRYVRTGLFQLWGPGNNDDEDHDGAGGGGGNDTTTGNAGDGQTERHGSSRTSLLGGTTGFMRMIRTWGAHASRFFCYPATRREEDTATSGATEDGEELQERQEREQEWFAPDAPFKDLWSLDLREERAFWLV
ncbi:heterokaryon incompatibility protein-domain-containing protein [Thelonectria olida]|uniref:Heterokaryon incompatibility protein-domain-containing protein n=1 Tax=Thelonectria olida TaxID=1576542 RepID=A0A9P9AMW6_9HYPO|nr:heterokaryon incompatibility protein-domain-containing protein [Thelonectria olida]